MIDPSHLPALQRAAKYRALRKLLRLTGFGVIAFGVVAFVVGVVLLEVNKLNAVMIGLGAALLILGAADLAWPRPAMLAVNGAMLVLLGCANIIIPIASAASRSGPRSFSSFTWITVAQFIWGIGLIKRYKDYKDTPEQAPPADMLQWLEATAKAIRATEPKTSPYVIEWTAQGGGGYGRWRAQLVDDLATAVDATGTEVLLVPRDQFNITKGRKAAFGKRFQITAQLGATAMKGVMEPEQFARYQAWRWAGAGQNGQGLWVPQA